MPGFDFHAPGVAEYYDELPLWSAPFGMLMLAEVPLRPSQRILDIGSGTGFLAVELAERCPGSEVIAVDPWPGASVRLREKARRLELDQIRVETCDAGEVDLEPESVDLIVSNLGVNNFDDAAAVLEHCHGVAKPGATIAITTNVVGHMQELYDEFRQIVQDQAAEALTAFDAHVEHRGTPDSTSEHLAAAGFQEVRRVESSFAMRYASGAAVFGHHLIRQGFLPAWEEVLPAGQAVHILEVLRHRLDEIARTRGELELTIPMLYLEAEKGG